jgi:hypothetical protein
MEGFAYIGNRIRMLPNYILKQYPEFSLFSLILLVLNIILLPLTQFILPKIFHYLDRFDKTGDMTLGYGCQVVK